MQRLFKQRTKAQKLASVLNALTVHSMCDLLTPCTRVGKGKGSREREIVHKFILFSMCCSGGTVHCLMVP